MKKTVDQCMQLHGENIDSGSCSKVCALYETTMSRDYNNWYRNHVQVAVTQWEELRLKAEKMASYASK